MDDQIARGDQPLVRQPDQEITVGMAAAEVADLVGAGAAVQSQILVDEQVGQERLNRAGLAIVALERGDEMMTRRRRSSSSGSPFVRLPVSETRSEHLIVVPVRVDDEAHRLREVDGNMLESTTTPSSLRTNRTFGSGFGSLHTTCTTSYSTAWETEAIAKRRRGAMRGMRAILPRGR